MVTSTPAEMNVHPVASGSLAYCLERPELAGVDADRFLVAALDAVRDGRWTPKAGNTTRTDDRVILLVDTDTRAVLREALMGDRSLHGIGYSDFVGGAVDAYEDGLWSIP